MSIHVHIISIISHNSTMSFISSNSLNILQFNYSFFASFHILFFSFIPYNTNIIIPISSFQYISILPFSIHLYSWSIITSHSLPLHYTYIYSQHTSLHLSQSYHHSTHSSYFNLVHSSSIFNLLQSHHCPYFYSVSSILFLFFTYRHSSSTYFIHLIFHSYHISLLHPTTPSYSTSILQHLSFSLHSTLSSTISLFHPVYWLFLHSSFYSYFSILSFLLI